MWYNIYGEKMNKLYYNFKENLSGIYEEKKSKFYSYVFNANNEEECLSHILNIKEKNKDARHVVYIYSILKNGKKIIRFSDDGEPQGTGTRAIYDTIEKENITNVCIVIVRYFGGILLGAGPLSRAYFKAYKNAIEGVKKDIIYNYKEKCYILTYSDYERLKADLKNYIEKDKIKIVKVKYNDNIKVDLNIREDVNEEVEKLIKKYI